MKARSRGFYTLILKGSVLSMLVFFSISFITFLMQINPFHNYKSDEVYRMKIGFPLNYYYQFFVNGNVYPNSGWNFVNLTLDCVLTWIIVVCGLTWAKRKAI